MISGPKPKPTAIKKLSSRSHHKQTDDEPKPESLSRVPRAPDWLGTVAKARWKELTKELYALNVLTAVDLDALARYCVIYERWKKAESMLEEQGELTKSPNGYVGQNPYLAIANRCLKQLQSLGAEFGLTPSTRTRVTTVQSPEESGMAKLEDELFGKPVKVSRTNRKR